MQINIFYFELNKTFLDTTVKRHFKIKFFFKKMKYAYQVT